MLMVVKNKSDLITRIHNSGYRLVIHLTGGGMSAVPDLLAVPGASRTILELSVPYSAAALYEIIGDSEAGAVSEQTAIGLAEAAFRRAAVLAGTEVDVAGVGCTAALSTDRHRRGSNRAHIAVRSTEMTETWLVDLGDEVGPTRASQDTYVGDAVLHAIAVVCGVT